jgi:hypothetical protein
LAVFVDSFNVVVLASFVEAEHSDTAETEEEDQKIELGLFVDLDLHHSK